MRRLKEARPRRADRFPRSTWLASAAAAAALATLPRRGRAANASLTVGATLGDDIAATLYGISSGTFSRAELDIHIEPLLSGAAGAGEYQPVIDAAAKYGFIERGFPAREFLLL